MVDRVLVRGTELLPDLLIGRRGRLAGEVVSDRRRVLCEVLVVTRLRERGELLDRRGASDWAAVGPTPGWVDSRVV
ncbi:MAG: hypothetical protein E6G39_04240 [Actinobacteria bacterium]|nr:MAG: hypothetical protein E6G39_04240 [Actinomycetota bacterium]